MEIEGIPLEPLGISPEQAAEFRAQVGKLAEDWDAPEMSVYDDAPADDPRSA